MGGRVPIFDPETIWASWDSRDSGPGRVGGRVGVWAGLGRLVFLEG